MKTVIFILILGFINFTYANTITIIEDSAKVLKGSKNLSKIDDINLIRRASSLSNVTIKSLKLTKIDNIQDLMALAVKENRVGFVEQFKYIKKYKSMRDGDKILLNCLKHPTCNLEKYSNLMNKSPLHRQFSIKYPNMHLAKINHIVGAINENIMHKYFHSTGWNKIEGEVGRNGIDGLYIKKKNGIIDDVMIVESKYNKSGLQYTKNGQQMTKQWISKKVENLKKKYPNNKDYDTIKKYIENNNYRALLWNLKIKDENLIVDLKKVHDKNNRIITSKLIGREKMKINYNGNQKININNPKNEFHKKVIFWYKSELKKY